MYLDNFYVDDISKNNFLSFEIKEVVLLSIKAFIEVIGREYVSHNMFFVDCGSSYIDSTIRNYNFSKFNATNIFRLPYNGNLNFYLQIRNISSCELAFYIIDTKMNKSVTVVIEYLNATLNDDIKISSIL